jgi:hypothetical protein
MPDQINLEVGAIAAVYIVLHIRVIDSAHIDEVVLQLRLVVDLVAGAVPLAGPRPCNRTTCRNGSSVPVPTAPRSVHDA